MSRGSSSLRGMSLVELMIAVSILSVGILGFVSAFGFITKSIQYSRAKSLAVNLAQEKMENLKNIPYYKLQLSTSVVVYSQFTPPIAVDNVNYPPEEIVISNIRFTRGVSIALSQVTDHYVESTSYSYPDTGLKFSTVYVWWQQAGEWKHVELSNVYENPTVSPLNATLTGWVKDQNNNAVAGALVKVVENPDWDDYTGTDGVYTLQAQAGTYTIRVSSSGYYDGSALNQVLQSGIIATKNFNITAIGSGTITGNVWLNAHPVISQVVVETNTRVGGPFEIDAVTGDMNPPLRAVEYIELFNPTTYAFNVASGGGGAPANQYLWLQYKGEDWAGTKDANDHGPGVPNNFNFTYVSTFIPPRQSYLIASATWFTIMGQWVAADAYYADLYHDYLRESDPGMLKLYTSPSPVHDTLGWSGQSSGGPWCAFPQGYEYFPVYLCTGWANAWYGLGEGNQIVRLSSPALASDTYGRAYDSDENFYDFLAPYTDQAWYSVNYRAGINYRPRNTASGAQTVLSGIPGMGALVTTDDLIGRSSQTYNSVWWWPNNWLAQPYVSYSLSGVSTGTWNVIIASGTYYQQIANVTVKQGVSTGAIQASSSPGPIIANHNAVMLSSYSVLGFLTGSVTDVNNLPISNIIVRASGSGDKTTNSAGRYFAQVSSGPINATFNPSNANGIYIEYVAHPDITTGQVTTQDAILTQGGTITGYLTTDGNSILPNIKVAATKSGLEYGVGTSDSSGYFYIRNLATGTYTVAPVLDPLEICNPLSVSTRVASVSTVFSSTFVVSGAQGKLSGTVKYNGELVRTGALVLVSTGALADVPVTLTAVDSPAKQVVYAASSKADGTYEVEVRGTTTVYNVKVYYPVTTATGATVTKKSYTATVNGSATTTLDLVLP